MASMRDIQIMMLIWVVGVVRTKTQICPYSDPACNCDVIVNWNSTTCYNLHEVPQLNVGVNVMHIVDLRFEGGNITSITNKSLPSGLREFLSNGHPLTNISDDVFDKSADTLEYISILGAKFINLPIALKELTKLVQLQLQDIPIQVWDVATLKNIAATLEKLILNRVGLSAWPSWISDFHLLGTLDLSDNPLNSIPVDAFSSIKDSLTTLDLSYTGLTEIPQALLTLSSLTYLKITGNHFTDVSEVERITGSPFAQKLHYLFLDPDEFTRIANFSNLTSLDSITLDYSRISYVPAGSLPLSISWLSISNNILSSVPKDVASMSGLQTLALNHNLITEIEPNSFLSSLTDLNLSFNNLATITNTSFRNLNFLRTLHLDLNPISTISPSAFVDLISLQYLSIEETLLTEIPLAFTRLSSKIDIYFSTTQSLSCPCPAPDDLVQWFTSLTNTPKTFAASCSNQELVDTYLRGECG